MKAFTVHQPFAYSIVAGLKPHETRTRRTNIRGRVAIHAGLKHPYHAAIGFNWLPAAGYIAESLNGSIDIKDLPRGVVVGTVEIVDCLPVEEVADGLTECEKLLGDYSPGRFAWVLANPVMFDKPIPARGQQGWWNWEETEAVAL